MDRIHFPDTTAAVIGALNSQLSAFGFAGVPVRSRVPNPRPARFVLVYRTGGVRDNNVVTERPQLTFEAWADDDAAAHDLAQAVRAIVGGLRGTVTGGVVFYKTDDEFSGPAYQPDPDSGQPRYTWTAPVQVRGVAV